MKRYFSSNAIEPSDWSKLILGEWTEIYITSSCFGLGYDGILSSFSSIISPAIIIDTRVLPTGIKLYIDKKMDLDEIIKDVPFYMPDEPEIHFLCGVTIGLIEGGSMQDSIMLRWHDKIGFKK